MGKQDKQFTMNEFDMRYGWACELCNHYDMEDNICAKGKHPRKYTLMDGPNEFCHAIKFCMKYSKWVSDDANAEATARGIRFAMDCGAQQYC